ncbi:hypothetical protein [Microtetraspora sp. NBRC 13810]|nr:hypothetical protein [Microtetraspora sp. NBRC 13810]
MPKISTAVCAGLCTEVRAKGGAEDRAKGVEILPGNAAEVHILE